MKLVSLLVSLASIVLTGCAGADRNPRPQPPKVSLLDAQTESGIDQLVQQIQTQYHIAGLGVSVVQNGRVTLAKGYGLADVAGNRAVDANTPFEIGSCTKSFTTFALMRIVDDPSLIKKPGIGKLDLDQPAASYLVGSPNITMPSEWSAITVRQLLSMTSGIPDGSSNSQPWQTVVADAAKKPLSFTPGTGYCYSNPGFMVIGEIIQQLTGSDYATFMANQVFGPLGMTNTFIHLPSNTPANLATGYLWNGTAWAAQSPRSPLSSFSSGAVITTASDMATWLAALAGQKVLSASAYAQMWNPVLFPNGKSSQWGLGWNVEISTTPKYTIYRKDGGLPGYSAMMSIYVGDGVSVGLITNESGIPSGLIAAQIVAKVKGLASVPNPPGPASDCD